MLIIEEVSWMSKSGCSDKELLEYLMSTMMKLNVNLMERSIRNPKDAIIIFVWTVN